MSASVVVEQLVVARGSRVVVREVSLDIRAGEVTALLGPNGAGKSTIVLALGGVLKPVSGRVLIDGVDYTGTRPEKIRQAGLAIVPEGRRLLGELTVEENLKVATYSLSRANARLRFERALEIFPELGARLRNPARALSGGEQQMVVLAQALITQPKFVVIDELSLGLAPVVVSRLIPTVRGLAEVGVGVLLIEQFAAVALALSERAYVLEGGQIVYSGAAAELRDRPEMLRSAYLLHARKETGVAAGSG